jgi:hypothetical protein
MKIISYIIGIIVTLAGILGFFSESILGMIDTNTIQNIVYVVLGLLLLMAVKKGKAMLPKIVGIIFAILGILGLVMSGDTVIGLVQNTGTANWFHLIIGIIILVIAFMSKGGSQGPSMQSESPQMPQQPEAPQQPQNPQM